MIFLLDTNVLSALRRPDRAPQVARWLGSQREDDLYLSVITLGEIERGIGLQQTRNPDFARDLRHWIDRTTLLFADRILSFGAEEARIWGQLSMRLGHSGANLLIAATAIARDATIVTGDADFIPTGARVENPY